MTTTVDDIYSRNSDAAEFARGYADYVSDLLKNLDCQSVARVIDVFCTARLRGQSIYFMGNGGSASTASHFANDFAFGTRLDRLPFKAVSLSSNNSILTALANDDGYTSIFRKQLEVYLQEGDVVVVISASGNSPNLVEAVEYANSRNFTTIGLLGFDGGLLKDICNHSIHIETSKGEYGPCEDLHMILDHLMCSYLYRWARVTKPATNPLDSNDILAKAS